MRQQNGCTYMIKIGLDFTTLTTEACVKARMYTDTNTRHTQTHTCSDLAHTNAIIALYIHQPSHNIMYLRGRNDITKKELLM